MSDWARDAFFYHVYPLGYCGAPERNDFASAPVPRLDKLTGRLDRVAALGANALLLGPVFESSAHGYDTVDHRVVDRRLGDAAALRRLAEAARARGMRLVFDGVFNHVGREHPWFRDLREQIPEGQIRQIRFGERGPTGHHGEGPAMSPGNACAPQRRLPDPRLSADGQRTGSVGEGVEEPGDGPQFGLSPDQAGGAFFCRHDTLPAAGRQLCARGRVSCKGSGRARWATRSPSRCPQARPASR